MLLENWLYYTDKNSLIFQGHVVERCTTLQQWLSFSVNFSQKLLVAPTFFKRRKLICTPDNMQGVSPVERQSVLLIVNSMRCNSRSHLSVLSDNFDNIFFTSLLKRLTYPFALGVLIALNMWSQECLLTKSENSFDVKVVPRSVIARFETL